MSEHTLAPWKTSEIFNVSGFYSTSVTKDGEAICGVYMDADKFCLSEAIANAALITSAPDMLEALKCFVDEQEFRYKIQGSHGTLKDVYEQAKLTIAKAEGK